MYQHLFGSVLQFWFTFLVVCKLMMCLAIHWIIHLIKQSNVLIIKSAKLREIKKQFFALKIIKYKYIRHLLWQNENDTKELDGINKIWQCS